MSLMDSICKDDLKKKYEFMADVEILDLALNNDSEDFSDGVYEILIDELKKRGLQQKYEDTKKQEPDEPNETMEDLVIVRRFTQGIEPFLAKSKLEDEGIEAFVDDDHIVSMNWLYSNLVGGIKLKVRASRAKEADEILSRQPGKDIPDKVEERGEDELCPFCNSTEIGFDQYNKRAVFLSWMLLGIPLPFLKRRCFCRKCGKEWKK